MTRVGLTENREFGLIEFYNNFKLTTFMKSTVNISYVHFMRISSIIGEVCVFRVTYINR